MTIIQYSTGYLYNPRFSKFCRAMKKYNEKKMVERGALSFSGARNPNLKIYWSAERYHISERGALIEKRLGAWRANSKIAWGAKRWRPPDGPLQ